MRSKLGLIILLLGIHHLSAATAAIGAVENMKEKDQERGATVGIAHHNKLGHGNIAISGGNSGTPAVSGQTPAGNGGSHSPNAQGGGGVTPLYAAGAANNHHPHRGEGNHDKGRTGPEILAATTFAWFLL